MSSEQVIAEILRDIDTFDEAIPVATVREYIDRLSTPAADYECRAHACRRVRVEMEARNAEQAFQLRFLLSERERADAKLTALLDGIEGLEKEWRRVTDPYTKGIVGRCADYLKALREKANGSHGVVPSARPWPGKCIK